ncbi:MAG: NirD/YgiW/YdeI family stress tolerance protein [Pseudomonadota bacterium]
MMPKPTLLAVALASTLATSAAAQFTGPSVQGARSTVAEALGGRVGRYVTLEGNIVAHQREDYYTFRDSTGDIRVEIPGETFAGRPIGPDDAVRLLGEVDSSRGGRYIWVKSLQPL